MTASAENSANVPAFVIATDLQPCDAAWPDAEAQAAQVRDESARIVGFTPQVTLAAAPWNTLPSAREIFVLPAPLDFSLLQRETLGRALTEARREHPDVTIHHDDTDPGHPLIVTALVGQVGNLRPIVNRPSGLILAPSGHGDAASRAQSYRLMRLIWEELGVRKAEIGFVRHVQPFLAHVLDGCLSDQIPWLILPQSQWETEHVAYARVMLENLQRAHPEAADWAFVDPPGAHPALTSWYVQRIVRLWQQKRDRESIRIRSAKTTATSAKATWNIGRGLIAQVPGRNAMAETLSRILPPEKPECVLVKVTWHGYATGTYTDPAALDLLLRALPAPAIILEGHTSSRNLVTPDFDWETEAPANRAWIRQQDAEYLRRTGLADVLTRHNAQYVNVTEAFWDGECVCRCEIEREVQLHHTELADFMPKILLQFRGCPFISFAKMKGPTRLGVSNLFGLIPDPLRDRWHGPNITWFARVCCDIAKLYGAFFNVCGVVEALFTAVRWNRQGLYRSRWGNYDLVHNAGVIAAGRGLVSADILASRLQGQDVHRSAFFDVVREDLGWDPDAAEAALPSGISLQTCLPAATQSEQPGP
jgi:sirohydrochlorin ferrochelatase